MLGCPVGCGAREQKMTVGTEQTRRQWRFSEVKHKHLTPVAVLANKSIKFFTNLCKPIEIYTYAKKNHPFTCYPAAKHPKHSKCAITDIPESLVNLFYCSTRESTLVSTTILLTQVPLQKFPFLFIIIIPWITSAMLWLILLSCLLLKGQIVLCFIYY